MKKGVGKRGQVTIFIIIAVLVVALGLLAYFLYPKITSSSETETQNPSAFIQSCMEDKIEETVETISLQGGSFEVDGGNSYFYLGNNVSYLCYTNQYYTPCVVQQPLLAQHIESEIKNEIEGDSDLCFEELRRSYEEENYNVDLNEGDVIVELLPERIATTFTHELTLTKGDSQRYEEFRVVLDSNLYQIVSISMNMIDWEVAYGEAPTSTYMDYYHNLKIERKQQLDGTNIYIFTDSDFGDVFQFASRSNALSPGY